MEKKTKGRDSSRSADTHMGRNSPRAHCNQFHWRRARRCESRVEFFHYLANALVTTGEGLHKRCLDVIRENRLEIFGLLWEAWRVYCSS
eukprot:548333-Amorphochlora_amoeboformis.AAC.1